MKQFFGSFFVRGVLAYLLLGLLGYSFIHAQPPSWLSQNNAPPVPPAVVGEPANPQAGNGVAIVKPRAVTKVVHDTITMTKTDTIVKYDTILPPKPVFYNYTIYYEMINKKLALSKNFEWDYENTAQKTQLQSSDTTLLSLGNEKLREASYSYDDSGHRMQTFEKIIEGLDMRVNGINVNITYRTGTQLLSLNGKFDNAGLMMLSSDFQRRRYFLYFLPLDFLGMFEKYTLFLRVEKTEVD